MSSSASAQTEKRQMGKAGLILSAATLFSRVLGLVRNQILSHYFGAGIAADAFIAAFTIPNALRRLFGEGALTPAFVSLFTREIQSGKGEDGWKSFLAATFFWLIAATTLITLIGILCSYWLVSLYVPEFADTPGKFELTVTLTQILWPFLVFISIAALFMGVLNSFNHFSTPALGPAVMNLTVILLAPLLFYLDFDGADDEYRIHLFAVVTVLSAVTQLIVQYPALKKIGATKLTIVKLKDRRVLELFALLGPSIFGMAIYQLNIIINRFFASDIPGAVSHLYYADLLIELPVSLIATSMGVAAVPSFSRLFHSGDRAGLAESVRFSAAINMGLAMPAAFGLIILAYPLISSVYYSGQFTESDGIFSAECLVLYAVGLPFFCGLRTLLPLFFAAKDTKTPAVAGLIAMLINLVMASKLAPTLGASGIALATSISSFCNFTTLLGITYRRFPDFPWRNMLWNFARTALAATAMALILWGLKKIAFTEVWALQGIRIEKIISILTFVGVGVLGYFGFAHILKIEEMKMLSNFFLKRLRRRT